MTLDLTTVLCRITHVYALRTDFQHSRVWIINNVAIHPSCELPLPLPKKAKSMEDVSESIKVVCRFELEEIKGYNFLG